MNTCANCGQATANPKFCCRRCSAIFTNKRVPRRKRRLYFCQLCGHETGSRRKYCDAHQPNALKSYDHSTIDDIRKQAKYQAHALIRNLARRTYLKFELPRQCRVCGYSIHIEICHIRSIQSFPHHTFIQEVNSPNNLVALCPNHHWEFDHHLISL